MKRFLYNQFELVPDDFTGLVIHEDTFFWFENGNVHNEHAPAMMSSTQNTWWFNGVLYFSERSFATAKNQTKK